MGDGNVQAVGLGARLVVRVIRVAFGVFSFLSREGSDELGDLAPKLVQLAVILATSTLLFLVRLVSALVADSLELCFLLGVERSILLWGVVMVINLDAGEGFVTK